MGRKLKYKTQEEKRLANNTKRMRYYEKNKETEKRKNLKRYYENKNKRNI
jgi:hypothetical protein